MFRFPSPSLSWGWVGQSGKKKKGTITWRGLGAREGRAAKYESLVTLSFCSQSDGVTGTRLPNEKGYKNEEAMII